MNEHEPRNVVPLPMTGERTAPETEQENYWFRRHEVVYRALLPLCRDKCVVEAGSGEGYGAHSLSGVADSVIGLDYDHLACRHAESKYGSSQLAFVTCSIEEIPLRDECCDVVVNSQVIEHIPHQSRFMEEAWRILRPGGLLIVSTPNRLTFTPEGQPINPFHIRELNPRECADLFAQADFDLLHTYGVDHGPALQRLDEKWGGIIQAQLLPYLENRPWSPSLIADVDSIRAEDFSLRTCPPHALLGEDDEAPSPLDDTLDLFYIGVKKA